MRQIALVFPNDVQKNTFMELVRDNLGDFCFIQPKDSADITQATVFEIQMDYMDDEDDSQ